MVEQRIENPRVGGSNPPPGTISKLVHTITNGIDKRYGDRIADTFVVKPVKNSTASASGVDTIYHFSRKGDDTIDLKAIDANTKAGGNQTLKFIGTA